MTTLREAAQQALDDLRDLQANHNITYAGTISQLEAALAQQAKPVEPVAWLTPGQDLHLNNGEGFRFSDWTPLYAAPPQRKPLPKHDQHCVDVPGYGLMAVRLVRAVERVHGIEEKQ